MISNLIKSALLSLFLICGVDLSSYSVGDYAEGGVIFWLRPSGDHGLVVSIVDMVSDLGDTSIAPWAPSASGSTALIGSTGNVLLFGLNTGSTIATTGQINSKLINTYYSGIDHYSYAAGLCSQYTGSGGRYEDWFLPSLVELGVMMTQMTTINTVSQNHGGAVLRTDLPYWSSVENGSADAYCQDFSSAAQSSQDKNTNYPVRAIRAF